jgi:archaellum biogenesis protein FlaJ (TadC family)
MFRLPFGRRRDPWWDMEGRSVRRDRRLRRLLQVLVLLSALVLLAVVFNPPAARGAVPVGALLLATMTLLSAARSA